MQKVGNGKPTAPAYIKSCKGMEKSGEPTENAYNSPGYKTTPKKHAIEEIKHARRKPRATPSGK